MHVSTVLVAIRVIVIIRIGGGEVAGSWANDLLTILSLLSKRIKISAGVACYQISSAKLFRLNALMLLVLLFLIARGTG